MNKIAEKMVVALCSIVVIVGFGAVIYAAGQSNQAAPIGNVGVTQAEANTVGTVTDSATNSANQADIPPQGNDVLDELVGSKYRHVFSSTQDWLFSFNSADSVQVIDTLRYPSINENCRIFKTNNGAEGDFVIELSKLEDMPGHKYTRESWACNYSGGILTTKPSRDYYVNPTDKFPRTVSIDSEAFIMDRQIN